MLLGIALCTTIYSIILLRFYLSIFLEKAHTKFGTRAWLSFCIWQIMINADLLALPPGIKLMLTITTTIFVGAGAYAGEVWKKIVFSVTYIALWMVLETLSWALLLEFCQQEPPVLVTSVVSKTLLLVISIGINIYYKRKNNNSDNVSDIKRLLWLPLLIIIFCYIFYEIGQEAGPEKAKVRMIMIVGTIMLIILDLSLYQFYIRLIEMKQIQKNNEMHQQVMNLYKEQREKEEHAINDIREIRHDYKQKLAYVRALAAETGNAELGAAVEKLSEDIMQKSEVAQITGVLAIDAIISNKEKEAKEKEIKIVKKLVVPPDLEIDDLDLCTLLGNAIDNAMEAVESLRPEERIISLEINYKKGALFITIKNKYQGEIEWIEPGKRIKSKKQTGFHGLGLTSMNKIVTKYHGSFQINNESEIFILKMYLLG